MKRNNKPKVAVIGLKGLPAFGGAATVGENIIEQLKDRYDFTVYSTSSHTDLKTGEYNGYKQIVFQKLPFKKLNSLYYYIISAFHAVFKGDYDLVHLHHRSFTLIIPLLKFRFPVILTTHGMTVESKFKKLKKIFDLQDKIFLHKASLITTVSKNDYVTVTRKYNVDRKKVFHIPNGVNVTPNMDSLLDFGESYLLFAAGRIIESKGCHIFLEALQRINYTGKVLIIGDLNHSPAYKKKILTLVKDFNNVIFLDIIKDKYKLFKYLKGAKVFIYPSFIESMSMMLLEVASVGTPIICAEIKANTDIFSSNEVIFTKPNNPDDLGKKIIFAISNYELVKNKAQLALKLVRKKYSWEEICEEYDYCFKQVFEIR